MTEYEKRVKIVRNPRTGRKTCACKGSIKANRVTECDDSSLYLCDECYELRMSLTSHQKVHLPTSKVLREAIDA